MIKSLKINSFQGIDSLEIEPAEKLVILVCGPNATGKTSVQDALRLALLGETPRVKLKADYPAMIRNGAKVATVEIQPVDGEPIRVALRGAKVEDSGAAEADPALAYCLDAPRFARIDANERRAFLFDLMDVATDVAGIRERLVNQGGQPELVGAIEPLLRSGFAPSCEEAKARARDAKTAWRTITGEPYGAVKAATWRANAPAVDVQAIGLARAALDQADQDVQALARELGAAQQAAQDLARRAQRLVELRKQAGEYARWAEKLRHDEKDLAGYRAQLAELPPAPGAPQVEPRAYACPCCGALLEFSGNLKVWKKPESPAVDSAVEERRCQLAAAVKLLESSTANSQRLVTEADAAAKALLEFEKQESKQPRQHAIAEIEKAAAEAKSNRRKLSDDLIALEKAADAAASAQKRTEDAQEHHTHAEAWTRLADLLAPDGVPAQLLAHALHPFNAQLAKEAHDSRWSAVSVDADMDIRYGLRPYGLCSESERWRADAMIAHAIAYLAMQDVVALDRADVLDIPARSQLFDWLFAWEDAAQAWIFATLKAAPDVQGIKTVWLGEET